MPTERFYHLSDEKKKLIREAAIKEFCRVPLEKVSINKIVQTAEISRGSFYTYFRDKEDVLEYIFEDMISQIQNFCEKVMEEGQGEFWKLPSRLLDYTMEICEKNKMFALVQSASGNRTVIQMLNAECRSSACPASSEQTKEKTSKEGTSGQAKIEMWLNRLYRKTDCSRLVVGSFEEFQALFSLCMMNMAATIGDIYQKGESREKAQKMFCRRLEMIRYGASKCI